MNSNEWQPIETAPVNKRFLAATIIPKHRLVIAFKTDIGLILDEYMKPLPWPMTHWMSLPESPKE